MKEFEEYFSFEAIVGDLIRWRLRGKDLGGVLPPRRDWLRAGLKGRKGVPPEVVRRQAIWRTVIRVCGDEGECCQCGNVASANVASCQLHPQRGERFVLPMRLGGTPRPTELRWVQNLMKLVDEVQGAVFSGKVAFEAPRMIKIEKGRENGVKTFREVASFDRLADRVILSRMTAYVRDRLEPSLTEHCYSFRRDASVTHQSAVKRLQEFRERFSAGSLFVAECDIKKFFDSISHDVVRRCWDGMEFDARARKVLEAYLAVYSSSETERRGLPQGGALSTVLANLVLRVADAAVQKVDDGQLFYARFCDDVVFVHPREEGCRRAMDAYAEALRGLELPLHPVEDFVYRPSDEARTSYYGIKSKGPFRWRAAEVGECGCAPWVSFLGSQIRYDGETRIRKESIKNHIRSLGRETAAAVREIQDGAFQPASMRRRTSGTGINVEAWFARFRNRLIAKGVGYVTAKVQDCGMCWAGAFPNVTACADTKMQMRRLDRVREGMLCKVWNILVERGELKVGRHRYKGRPFSYFGFLEKAVRPTNMARRRRIVRMLPYSAL